MATAQDVINRGAKWAGILAQGQVLEAGINSDALDTLNIMLDRWQNDGIELGLSTLTAATTLFIDDADREAIELGLGIRIAVMLRRPVSSGLSTAFKEALTELQAKYQTIPEMSLDPALTRKYLPRKGLDGSSV